MIVDLHMLLSKKNTQHDYKKSEIRTAFSVANSEINISLGRYRQSAYFDSKMESGKMVATDKVD